jgi:hypothetical protein
MELNQLKDLKPTVTTNHINFTIINDPWYVYGEEKVDDSTDLLKDLVMSPSSNSSNSSNNSNSSNSNRVDEDLISFEDEVSPRADIVEWRKRDRCHLYWHWKCTPKQGRNQTQGKKIHLEQDYYQTKTFNNYLEYKDWESKHLQKDAARILLHEFDSWTSAERLHPISKIGSKKWLDNITKHFNLDPIFIENNKQHMRERKRLVTNFLRLALTKGIQFEKHPKNKWWLSSCKQLVIEDFDNIEDGKTALLTTTISSFNLKDIQLNSLLQWKRHFGKSKKRFVYDMIGKSDSELNEILDKVLECRRLNN